MKMKIKLPLILFIICVVLACQSNPVPRPRGYFRIDLPVKEYRELPSIYSYCFQYPEYAKISKYEGSQDQSENTDNWLNIDFPDYKAHIYLTFKAIDQNLGQLIDDSHTFVYKHISRAEAINQTEFTNPEESVFGLLFDIKGNTATALQFYLTDSISNFVRGALYFDCEPNKDSLAPVIEYFRKDILVLMESFRWT